MRKTIFALLLTSTLTVSAQGVLSPTAKMAIGIHQQDVAKTRAAEDAKGIFILTCKDGASPAKVANALKPLGAKLRLLLGNQLIVEIPMNQVEVMEATEGIALIDVLPKVNKKTDVSRKATQADEVQEGTGAQLPQAYTGKGVTIGLIDGGFDYTHPIFKDKDGNLRIKAAYNPALSEPKGEAVTAKVYDEKGEAADMELIGSLVTDPKVILDTLQLKDTDGSHGTHCASIAAGSIMSDVEGLSGKPLGGMAPEADLVLSTLTTDDATKEKLERMNVSDEKSYLVAQSLGYFADYAKKSDKPFVLSMSINSHEGFHDGTSSMARLLGNFCKQGNALMLCSSNEGNDNLYTRRTIKKGDTLTIYIIPNGDAEAQCSAYMKTSKQVEMQFGMYDYDLVSQTISNRYIMPYTFKSDSKYTAEQGATIEIPSGDIDGEYPSASDKKIYQEYLKHFEKAYIRNYISQGIGLDQNNKQYSYVQFISEQSGVIYAQGQGATTATCTIAKIIPSEDIELFAWADQQSRIITQMNSSNQLTIGSNEISVGDWNTSGEPVSVGAWTATNQQKTDAGLTTNPDFTIGNYAPFSSFGTDFAGHTHPQVCAPGVMVNAALNSFSNENDDIYFSKTYDNQFTGQSAPFKYNYGPESGTSMSTPAAAGIVALWMQAANDKGKRLTCADIKDIIANSSDTDDYTKAAPERFGYGKINAYKGLLYVLGLSSGIEGLSMNQPEDITFRVAGDILYADGAEDGLSVSIYNLQGILVSETTVQGGTVSLAGLQKGVYAVQLGKLGSTLIRK